MNTSCIYICCIAPVNTRVPWYTQASSNKATSTQFWYTCLYGDLHYAKDPPLKGFSESRVRAAQDLPIRLSHVHYQSPR